ncbi:MAG TPA: hypothetical protein VMH35_01845 [Streptosporangiaceae bacterium]|nr:hypothetical protein [Streptosporangiaceae bacterium]
MWIDIGIAALLLFTAYAFLQLVGIRVRGAARRSNRRAEDLYPQFADSLRKQRRYAREHGGTWSGDAGQEPPSAPRRPASPPGR